jgi:hypothetical protein
LVAPTPGPETKIVNVLGVAGPPASRRAPGETWQVAGGVLFGLGLLAILTAIVPLVLGTGTLPLGLRLAPLLAPLGLLVGLVGPAKARRAAASSSGTAVAGPRPAAAPAPDRVVLPDPSSVTPA